LRERVLSPRARHQARVYNLTKGTVLASCAEIADYARARLIGLLGRRALAPGGGVWLVPGNSIHTIGMRFSIDVVMLDRNAGVVGVRESVRPFSIIWPNLRAKSILELPVDTIAKSSTETGDLLQIEIGNS
jgi:uncharacterized protein